MLAKAVGLALSPVLYGLHIGAALLGWAVSNLSASMQLPLRLLTAALQLADGLICDLLAVISREPGLKSQVRVRAGQQLPGCGCGCGHGPPVCTLCTHPPGILDSRTPGNPMCMSQQPEPPSQHHRQPCWQSLAAAVGLCVLTRGQSIRGS